MLYHNLLKIGRKATSMQIKYWEVAGLGYRVGVSVEDKWFHFEDGEYVLSAMSTNKWTGHKLLFFKEISQKRMLLICDQPIFTEEIYKKCLTKQK